MEKYEIERLLISGAVVTLPDGRKVNIQPCYLYELEAEILRVIWSGKGRDDD